MAFREALGTRTFWAITVTSMTTFYAILGVAAHVLPALARPGFETAAAARGISWLFLMGLIGMFSFGFLADRCDHKRVLMGNLAIMLLGSVALAPMRPEGFWPFAILSGRRGGFSAAGSRMQRAKNIEDSPELHFADARRIGKEKNDPEIPRLYTATTRRPTRTIPSTSMPLPTATVP